MNYKAGQQVESSSAHARQLMERIENQTARIGILGLGYVGLPLSKALLENGFEVIGFDVGQPFYHAMPAERHIGLGIPTFMNGDNAPLT